MPVQVNLEDFAKPWRPGIYPKSTTVIYDNQLWILNDDIVGLFTSSDFLAEVANGDWIGRYATEGDLSTKEDLVNKAVDFSIINHDLYPSVEAVVDYLSSMPSSGGSYAVINRNVIDSSPVTGTIAQTTVETFTIPANTFEVGDIILFRARIVKTGTAGVVNHRHRIGGSINYFFQTSAGTNIFSEIERRFVVKSTINTQEVGASVSALSTTMQTNAIQEINIDWTVDQDLELRLNLGNAGDSAVVSFWELSRIR